MGANFENEIYAAVVIGAGQAGLAAAFELAARGLNYVVLDANDAPGGAWQHRWDSLTMRDVHGIANFPKTTPPPLDSQRANEVVPKYFDDFEDDQAINVIRPAEVTEVRPQTGTVNTDPDSPLVLTVHTPESEKEILTRAVINATGTWRRPFIPFYPGIGTFTGKQFHAAHYPGPKYFEGKRTLVVGGGASAVQFLGEIGPLTDTLWVTRRPVEWFDADKGFDGLAVVERVEERVVAGLPPKSVVSETGIMLREQEQEAKRLGVYDKWLPIFDSIEPDGVRWQDGRFEPVDVILWATGFRPDIDHLAPLSLRSSSGGVALERVPRNVQGATTSQKDHRVHFVGYGPSASTIGATRAARTAARAVEKAVKQASTAIDE